MFDARNRLWVKILSFAITFTFLFSGTIATSSDSLGNPSESTDADLSIHTEDITLSDSTPISGTPVTITATVHGDPSTWINSSEQTLAFADNFDSGNLNKWVQSNWNPCGVLEASTAQSNSPQYSLHCQSNPGTNTGPWVLKFLDDCYAHSITETKFYLPIKSQAIDKWDIIRVGSSTGTVLGTTNYEFYVTLRDDDYSIDLFEYVKDANGQWNYGCLAMDVCELAPQTWHDVSLEITPNEYILNADGAVIASGQRAVSTLIHHLILGDEGGSGGCWGDSYWDDVSVWSVSETQTGIPGSDANCTVSFYLDSQDPANLIGCVENVFVPADGQTLVGIDWNPVAGEHEIVVVVSDVDPTEGDLSDNIASLSVSVSDVGQVDLFVNDLSLSNPEPVSGTPVTITANVNGDQSVTSDWVKSGVVLDLGGWGEDIQVFDPCVLKLDNGTYLMFYAGKMVDGTSSSYHHRMFKAFSYDGLTWFKEGMVLDYGGPYAGNAVYHPNVWIAPDGTYHMWYAGQNPENGNRARILHATSQNGFNFVYDGLEINYGGATEPASVNTPFVMVDETGFRMWYTGTAWSPLANWINMAHKATLAENWVEDGPVLLNDGAYDNPHAQRPWVMETEGGYEMFYSGTDAAGITRVLHAVSQDGINWTKDGIVIEPTLPLEGSHVRWCSVMVEDGTYRMWYTGLDGTSNRIFYAEKAAGHEAMDANCTVSFYLDSVDSTNLIGTVENVFVPADGQTPVNMDWMPVAGEHEIIVVVSDVDPADSNLTNNIASIPVLVEASGEVDLSITSDDIAVPQNASVGDACQLSATVHNLGDGQGIWEKQGVVLGPGITAEYPYVIKDGSTYKMWYTGFGTTPDIYYATSPDRVTWTNYGKVLTHPTGTKYAAAPSVIKEANGTYKMWYSCQNYNWNSEIYYAISNDGVAWTQLGKVLPIGPAGSFDAVYACQGYVFKDAGLYKMYYKAYDSELVSRFGFATSQDGIAWTKYGAVMDTPAGYAAMECPFVLPNVDGSFDMWFSTGKILKTNSADGITWDPATVALDVTPGAQDSRAIYTPCVLRESGDSYMYYSGDSGSTSYIFMAEMTDTGQDATCTVSFYLDSADPANLIDSVANVFVPVGGQTPVSIDWTAVAGEHEIIVVVSDVDPADIDLSNNVASKNITVNPDPAALEVTKVRLSGPEEGYTHTYYEWELLITVTNTGGAAATDVLVRDVLPAELGLLEANASAGSVSTEFPGTRSAPPGDTILPVRSTHIFWTLETLEPGQSETLYLKVCTRLNPAGKQEFTSPGTYIINEGAYATGTDSLTGDMIESEHANAITVVITDNPQLVDNTAISPKPPAVTLPKTVFFVIASFACILPAGKRPRRKN